MPSKAWVYTDKCVAPLLRLVLHEDDTELTAKRKRLTLVLHLILFFVCGLMFPLVIAMYSKIAVGIACLTALVSLVHLAASKQTSDMAIVLPVLCYTISIMLFDLTAAVVMQQRVWPIFVVLLDILLVCKIELVYTLSLIGLIVVWLIITSLEGEFRFGLYDIPGTVGLSERKKYLDCGNPPCSTDAFAVCLVPQVLIVGLDFYFTRGFAEAVLQEKEKVEVSVETAKDVAHSLAIFDLDTAHRCITAATNLPTELRSAFQHLLRNLHAYRPYLSDALFHTLHPSPSVVSYTAPPGDNGVAAIVFTDIEGSTSIWEASPEGMRKGLTLHNEAVRECLTVHNGYEVKTIGDAFMVAFESVVDAVRFGLGVQEKLAKVEWPEEFNTISKTKDDGLRIRVGINYGPVQVESNTVTNRFDYFGKAVNKAARVEGFCIGGVVAVTQEVMDELEKMTPIISTLPTSGEGGSSLPESPLTIKSENVSLKGVAEPQTVTTLIPRTLGRRREAVIIELNKRDQQQRDFIRTRNRGSHGTPFSSYESQTHRSDNSIKVEDITGNQDFLRGRLEIAGSCTAGRVEIRHAVDEDVTYDPETLLVFMNDGLERVFHCLNRSGGSTVGLIGSSIALGWNTAKRCDTHLESAVRFCALLHQSPSRYDCNPSFHIGLSTGSLLYGNVGSQNQRFTTMIGPVSTLAGMLSVSAVDLNVTCLFAVTHHQDRPNPLFKGLKNGWIRPVDLWQLPANDYPLTVYQINLHNILESPFLCMIIKDYEDLCDSIPEDVPWCWSNAYWTAFYKQQFDDAITSSPSFLADPTAVRVRDMLLTGKHLRDIVIF